MLRSNHPQAAIRDGGAVAVEFGLLLPIFLLLLFGLVEFGRVVWTQATLSYAVQAAARCAAIDKNLCASPEAVQQYAASRAPGLSLPTSTFAVTVDPCGAHVTASLVFEFVVPALLPYSQTLSASACYPV